jgi:hypothetical protein
MPPQTQMLLTMFLLAGVAGFAVWWWDRDREQRQADNEAIEEWERMKKALAPRSLP